MISTSWVAKPAPSASAIRTGCIHEAAPMSAAYEAPDVQLRGGLDVDARFNLRNTSAEAWRAADGFAAGFHIYDADTGTLIVDGERQPPPRDIAPGDRSEEHTSEL